MLKTFMTAPFRAIAVAVEAATSTPRTVQRGANERSTRSVMEFRVLGPLEVVDDGRAIRLGSGKQVALVAYLLVHRTKPSRWTASSTSSGAKPHRLPRRRSSGTTSRCYGESLETGS